MLLYVQCASTKAIGLQSIQWHNPAEATSDAPRPVETGSTVMRTETGPSKVHPQRRISPSLPCERRLVSVVP